MSIVMMMGAAAVVGAGGGGDVVTLSGQTVNAFNFSADARAELRCHDDGQMYQKINAGSYLAIDTGTDWVIPNGSAPGTYQTRYTNLTGDALHFSTSAAEDTYRALSIGPYFFVSIDTTTFAGGNDSTFDIEIRDGVDANLASTSYRLIADREDF